MISPDELDKRGFVNQHGLSRKVHCKSITYSLQSRRLSSRSDHADRRASTLITYDFGLCFTVSGLSQATLQDCLKTLKKSVSSPDFDIIFFPQSPSNCTPHTILLAYHKELSLIYSVHVLSCLN